MVTTEFCDDHRIALGTVDTRFTHARLCKLACGIFAARIESSELSASEHHIGSAFFALEIGNDGFLFRALVFFLSVSGSGGQGLGIAAGGIVGTSGKFTEASVSNDHAAAAFVTNDVGLLGRNLNALFPDGLFSRLELLGKIVPEAI